MKKILIFLLLINMLLSVNVIAQYKPFVFGFELSPNIGWMKPDPAGYENKGTPVGFSWGFVSEFFLMENYAITTGFNVSYLNSKLTYPHKVFDQKDSISITGTLSRFYKLKYIEIPLMLKMKTKEFGKMKFFGQIGLGTGFIIGAKADDDFKADGYESIKDEKKDIKDQVKTNRESLILGLGLEYSVGGSTAIIVGFNFNNGFTDVLKDQNTVDPEIEHKAINNFFELNIGVLF